MTASLPPHPGESLEERVREVAVGDLLDGKWEVKKKLGEGGMGTVVLAHERELRRDVAIKLLARHLCSDSHAVARFEREARLTAQLDHPNIVPVYAVGRFHERPFMVMKHLEGASLWKMLKERTTPWEWMEIRAFIEPLCRALGFLHGRGLVHRDVKPSNVIVAPDGHVTLLDFGILKESSKDVTTTGMALGTYGWMAPEQVVPGGTVDARADLYALGAMVYRMLVGRAPFVGEEAVVAQQKLAQEAPDPRSFNAALSVAMAASLKRALRRDRDERFASAQEFLAALDSAHAAPTEVLEAGEMTPPASRRPVYWGLALTALAAVVGLSVWAKSSPPARPATAIDAPVSPPALALPAPVTAPSPPPVAAVTPETPRSHAAQNRDRRSRPPAHLSTEPLKVSVVSRVSGKSSYAELFVDGKRAGETPTLVDLSPGYHRIKLVRDGLQPWDERVEFGSGHNERLVIDLHP